MRGKLRTVKNAVVHVVLLAVIFLVAVVLFERWINESSPLEAEEMASVNISSCLYSRQWHKLQLPARLCGKDGCQLYP